MQIATRRGGGALEGVRVLDLSQFFAGPYCTRLLSDYGAEVVKIERPLAGDGARRLGPFPSDIPDGIGGAFAYLNAGKASITLDLATPTGRSLLLRLAREADVIVESFRPETLQRFGLDFAALSAVQPRIVLCSITNFGQNGPHKDDDASELVMQSMVGLVYMTGAPEREPIGLPMPVTQYVAGLQAYIAILAAVWLARATGEGEHIDVSIREAFLALEDTDLARHAYTGYARRRYGHHHWVQYPGSVFKTSDGFVLAFGVLQRDWDEIANVIGRPELASDPRFQSPNGRRAYTQELDEILGAWIAQRTSSEVYRTMQARRVPFAIEATADDLLRSEHLKERDYFRSVSYADLAISVPGPPFRLGSGDRQTPPRAPILGADNETVYCERLGLTRAELSALAAKGIV